MRSCWRPWSLRRLTRALATGDTTPAQVERSARERIAASEPEVRAWVTMNDASAAPQLSDGATIGVPMGVKDIIDVAGLPTGCGSALRHNAPAALEDATIVSAWRSAGAVPLGKTVTTEFAYFSPGPTRNPADLGRTPGGSSSGSAAAVASGQVPLAIGSQTAGSVTRPAAYCGVAALVMCRGRFPTDGVIGLAESLDAHGVYAATVDDLALAWSMLTGEPDAADTADIPPVRLLSWSAEPFGVITAEMRDGLAVARSILIEHGGVLEPFSEESLIDAVTDAHAVVMAYEAARERVDELAVADRLSPPLAELLRRGARTTATEYDTAREVIRSASAKVADLLAGEAAVIGPAAPGPAPRGLDATGDPVLSRGWQALGLAAVTVPGLRDAAGLPLGIQVVAESESTALRVGAWMERNLRGRGPGDR